MNVIEDRENVTILLNKEMESEGLPALTPTGKAFVSPAGFVWHEFKDDHGYLSYTCSSTWNKEGLASNEYAITGAADLNEAFSFDEDFLA